MRCIICGEKTENVVCPVCGFDASRCPELYPTFSKGLDLGEAIWECRFRYCRNVDSKALTISSKTASKGNITVSTLNTLNKTIAVGYRLNNIYVIGIKPDGSIVSTLNYPYSGEFSSVKSAISVAAGTYHAVCLLSGGRVAAYGYSWRENGQCNVQSWRGIKAVGAGEYHTVGLRNDGTVLGCGRMRNGWDMTTGWLDIIKNWKDIVYIDSGTDHIVGIREGGSVVAFGNNYFGQCDVSEWRNVISVAAGKRFTIGLCADGTIVKTRYLQDFGNFMRKRCTAIAAGAGHAVILEEDGTVVIVDGNANTKTLSWTDVIAVAAGDGLTVGLRKDGTVLADGQDSHKFDEINGWRLWIPKYEQSSSECRSGKGSC